MVALIRLGESGVSLVLIPNPIAGKTSIAYAFPTVSEVRVCIYNTLGQEVQRIVDGLELAGRHEAIWKACDSAGQ
jgi:hypothetical protein